MIANNLFSVLHQPFYNHCGFAFQAFCSLLKRDMSLNFKSKGNCLVSVCACSVLMAAFAKEENWPDDFVKVRLINLMYIKTIYPASDKFVDIHVHVRLDENKSHDAQKNFNTMLCLAQYGFPFHTLSDFVLRPKLTV